MRRAHRTAPLRPSTRATIPDLGGADCVTIGRGFAAGGLACRPDCSDYVTSACVPAGECGNGARDGLESCDGADLAGADCASVLGEGFAGPLACSSTCTFDPAACVPPPSSPVLRKPMNDRYLGSVHAPGSLRPIFAWEASTAPSAAPIEYELHYSTDAAFLGDVTVVATARLHRRANGHDERSPGSSRNHRNFRLIHIKSRSSCRAGTNGLRLLEMRAGITGGGRGDLAHLLQRGRRTVSVDDATRALSLDRREAAKRLAHWASMGWLRRVRRGLYIPVPLEAENPAAWSEDALYLADVVWAPCYFTGWTAANHWELTEQLFRTIVVKTTQRVRASRQRLLDHEYLLSHVPADRLWGVRAVWRHDRRIQMADPTRTMVDVLDEPALAGGIRHAGENLVAYLADHDGRELLAYGDRLGNRTVFKRLGYLLEVLAADRRDLIDECRQRLPAGFSVLEPGGPNRGTLSGRWGLRVNARIAPEGAS